MMNETLSKLEAKLSASSGLKDENRTELLQLLHTLKGEVSELAKTEPEKAQSITGFTEVSTHEATRSSKDPALLNLSIEGLQSSVDGFETSHPRLVQVVNSICTTLSNMGI